jgi:hypothetical protein
VSRPAARWHSRRAHPLAGRGRSAPGPLGREALELLPAAVSARKAA